MQEFKYQEVKEFEYAKSLERFITNHPNYRVVCMSWCTLPYQHNLTVVFDVYNSAIDVGGF